MSPTTTSAPYRTISTAVTTRTVAPTASACPATLTRVGLRRSPRRDVIAVGLITMNDSALGLSRNCCQNCCQFGAARIAATPANPRKHCVGGVAERSNAAVLKTAEVARLPWVRIPPPPHVYCVFAIYRVGRLVACTTFVPPFAIERRGR